jgi:hypothetical protein
VVPKCTKYVEVRRVRNYGIISQGEPLVALSLDCELT